MNSAELSGISTVLVARSPQDPPSELELQLRQEAKRVRIVESLSGGAHLLFTGSETTIAVRTYYEDQVIEFDSKPLNIDPIQAWNHGNIPRRGNMDELESFRDSFKYSAILFIMESSSFLTKQLTRADSFVNLSQMIMNDTKKGNSPNGNSKIFIVPNAKAAIDTIIIILDTLRLERRKLRDNYYMHTRALHFLPDDGKEMDQRNISTHVAKKFRRLAEFLDFNPVEAKILMDQLGSLYNIATADFRILQDIPIENSSKKKLHEFFGSEDDPNKTHSMEIDEFRLEDNNENLLAKYPPYHYHHENNSTLHFYDSHQKRALLSSMTYSPEQNSQNFANGTLDHLYSREQIQGGTDQSKIYYCDKSSAQDLHTGTISENNYSQFIPYNCEYPLTREVAQNFHAGTKDLSVTRYHY